MGLGKWVANGKPWTKKKVKRRKRLLLSFEVLLVILFMLAGVAWYVPSIKNQVVKTVATSSIGKYIISLVGKQAYDKGVYDIEFNEDDLYINEDIEHLYTEEYTNFVMFGIDSRTEQFDDQTNSDTIMIVSIHNTTGEVKLVSIYRDTYSCIMKNDGTTFYAKINAAYASGGATAALNTINTNMDLNIKDYVVVNFSGVTKLIDALGGIDVNLTDGEVSQLNHHLKSTILQVGEYTAGVTNSGWNHLNGMQATTYCRIRKTTYYDEETGEAINDDFGRAARQRAVIMKLVDRAKDIGILETQEVIKLIFNSNSESSKIISTSFTFDEILNLLPVVFEYSLSESTGFPIDYSTGYIGAGSYVMAKGHAYNVSKLHYILFGAEGYEPSQTVMDISSNIAATTGLYSDTDIYYPEEEMTESQDTIQ